jgi:hypothetical protein
LQDQLLNHTKAPESSAQVGVAPFLWLPSGLANAGEMRRILLSAIKIVVSAALLYFALRKINFADLASRIDEKASKGAKPIGVPE